MPRISPNFWLSELTRTDTGKPNEPTVEVAIELTRLCWFLLEPIRAILASPIAINSGYRSPEVNGAIPEVGASASPHLEGRAADIRVPGLTPAEVFEALRRASHQLPMLDQAILESGCVHVVIPRLGQKSRQQFLVRRGSSGAWTYHPPLPLV